MFFLIVSLGNNYFIWPIGLTHHSWVSIIPDLKCEMHKKRDWEGRKKCYWTCSVGERCENIMGEGVRGQRNSKCSQLDNSPSPRSGSTQTLSTQTCKSSITYFPVCALVPTIKHNHIAQAECRVNPQLSGLCLASRGKSEFASCFNEACLPCAREAATMWGSYQSVIRGH